MDVEKQLIKQVLDHLEKEEPLVIEKEWVEPTEEVKIDLETLGIFTEEFIMNKRLEKFSKIHWYNKLEHYQKEHPINQGENT